MKPTVFIGSSSEAFSIAEALAGRLADVASPKLWDSHDIFRPSESTLKGLVDASTEFDFAVFVFTADDLTISRQVEDPSPRDNVVFEVGLFMGAIGPTRTFVVFDRDARPKLPSDLAGITLLPYSADGHADPSDAIVEAARVVKMRVSSLGPRARRQAPTVYWCGPHDDRFNPIAQAALERYGFDVKMPDTLLPHVGRISDPKSRAATVRKVCCAAIADADVVVVNVDSYGLDSAWEMGYSEALGKPIVGFNRSDELVDPRRVVNKRLYLDNYMHGWDEFFVSDSLDDIADRCRQKIVYLFCPYKNTVATEQVCGSRVAAVAARVIVSNRDLGIDPDSPGTYSWRVRKRALQFLDETEVILTVLPRYGMDTAWKLGYAAAIHKESIGWLTNDFGTERTEADFLDHWMHGWRKKPVVSTMFDLAALVNGLSASPRRT